MSTEVLCPQCGGMIFGSDDDMSSGRRCTCGQATKTATAVKEPGSDSTVTSLSGAASGVKVCVACGVDVTNQKRMKDSKGKYWCYECGAKDQARKGESTGVTCPDCLQSFAPTKLIRYEGQYL